MRVLTTGGGWGASKLPTKVTGRFQAKIYFCVFLYLLLGYLFMLQPYICIQSYICIQIKNAFYFQIRILISW